MSVLGGRVVGIPTVIIHEANGLAVTVEMRDGLLYHGLLEESEDTWNLKLRDVICFQPDGNQFTLTSVFVRGSQITYVILPDMLANSPMFTRVMQFKKGKTAPVGMKGKIMRQARGGYGRGRFGRGGGGFGRDTPREGREGGYSRDGGGGGGGGGGYGRDGGGGGGGGYGRDGGGGGGYGRDGGGGYGRGSSR